MKLNKTLYFMLAVIALWSCGDDDEAGGGSGQLVRISDLQGLWTTDSWVTGPGAGTGLLTIEFDVSAADADITALSANDFGFSCGEITIRTIVPLDENSFTAEGLIRFVGGSFEWVPTTITLNSDTQINIAFDCAGCSNASLVLEKIPTGETSSVIISRNIDQPTTLTNLICDPDQPDYIVTDLIDVDDILTIEPGVIVAFEANAGLNIDRFNDGVLIAKGTTSDPITFTGVAKTKGFWRGILVESNDVRNEMDYVIVEYAGSDVIANNIKGGVRGAVAIDGSSGGLFGSLKLTNSIIRENDGYGLVAEWIGLIRTFSNNTFEDNTNAAVITEAPNVAILDAGSSYTGGNGYEGVEIFGNSAGNELVNNSTWKAFADGSTYYVSKSIEIESTLTIQPGATFEFEANQTMIFNQDQFGPQDGVLIAEGTATAAITFTGFSKTPGYWRGLIIQSNSVLNNMEYCIVEFGGSDPIAGGSAGNIGLDKDGAFDAPRLSISNSTIRNSAGCGIVVESDQSVFSQSANTFSANSGGNICEL